MKQFLYQYHSCFIHYSGVKTYGPIMLSLAFRFPPWRHLRSNHRVSMESSRDTRGNSGAEEPGFRDRCACKSSPAIATIESPSYCFWYTRCPSGLHLPLPARPPMQVRESSSWYILLRFPDHLWSHLLDISLTQSSLKIKGFAGCIAKLREGEENWL